MKKYLGLEDMSNVNCSSVLNVIREAGETSRKEISAETGLSWAGMTKIVNKLFEKGLIVEREAKEITTGAGRTPRLLSIRRDKNVIVGLDVNREGLRGIVINLSGEIRGEYFSELVYSNKEELLEEIISFTSMIVDKHHQEGIMGLGVAMQGEMDVERGISRRFPYCNDWKDVPIRDILKEKFNYKIYIEHDPNCILYEKIYKGITSNTLLFRIDRSIGMAVYIDGSIVRGDGIWEVKNCIVVPGGNIINEIQEGSLEYYVAKCLDGDVIDKEAVSRLIKLLMNFIYNMALIFNARRIILSGELITHKNEFEKELREEFVKYDICNQKEIILSPSTERVAYGAALIAADIIINS